MSALSSSPIIPEMDFAPINSKVFLISKKWEDAIFIKGVYNCSCKLALVLQLPATRPKCKDRGTKFWFLPWSLSRKQYHLFIVRWDSTHQQRIWSWFYPIFGSSWATPEVSPKLSFCAKCQAANKVMTHTKFLGVGEWISHFSITYSVHGRCKLFTCQEKVCPRSSKVRTTAFPPIPDSHFFT